MIRLTENAIAEVRKHASEAPGGLVVRVGLADGGCAGTKYLVEPAESAGDDDVVFEQDGVRIVCAAADLPKLDGLQVDFVEAMVGGGFQYDNPNATARCSCGQSFSTDF